LPIETSTAYPRIVIDPARKVRPPGGVRFAGWMIGIGAFFSCLGGVLLLALNPNDAFLSELGLTPGLLQLVGFVLLAIGLVEFLLIYALYGGSNVARIITTVLVGLSAVSALLQALSRSSGAFVALIQLIIAVAILLGLWGPNGSEWFRRPDDEAPSTAPPPPPPPAP
jgi:uncharacterized membrane protein YuzA (DUF378 family)